MNFSKLKNNKNIYLLIVFIFVVIAVTAAFSYAYMTSDIVINETTNFKVNGVSNPSNLTLTNNIINVNKSDFDSVGTNVVYYLPTIKLSSSADNTYETNAYQLEYKIHTNTFKEVYGDEVSSSVKLLLKIKTPDMIEVGIDADQQMEYITIDGVSGYDITNYVGSLRSSINPSLTLSEGETEIEENWIIELTVIGDISNQYIESEVVLHTEEIDISRISSKVLNADNVRTAPDDYGTSTYYKGDADNNWLLFAGSYWRIIKVNGDDSTKIIYAGKEKPTEENKISGDISKSNLNLGVQLSYGSSYDEFNQWESNIILNSFYSNELEDFILKLEDNSFCSETSRGNSGYQNAYLGFRRENTPGGGDPGGENPSCDPTMCINCSGEFYDPMLCDPIMCSGCDTPGGEGGSGEYSEVYNTAGYIFSSVERLTSSEPTFNVTNHGATLECSDSSYRYTVYDTVNGNGDLTNQIGMLTADEYSVITSSSSTYGSTNYLNGTYLTMTPFGRGEYYMDFENSWDYTSTEFSGLSVWKVNGTSLSYSEPAGFEEAGIRPVINLDYDVVVYGSGTWNDPYIVLD